MVSFSCQLPFVQSLAGGHWQAGFISLPAGTFAADPLTRLQPPTASAPSISGYYDRAVSRWLPVGREAVAPDGLHYAFTDRPDSYQQSPPSRATLHVVSVKTGVDLAFDGGYWFAPYYVLDYTAEGIYLYTSGEGQRYGLWLMNPATGAIKQVAALTDVLSSAGNKSFWVGSVNPSDPNPMPGMGGTPDQIEKFNLVDGSHSVWFYQPGSGVSFLGLDLAGHPIVSTYGPSGQPTAFFLVPSPGTRRSILTATPPLSLLNGLASPGSPIADSHGVWFGSPDGIYVYPETGGLQRVSTQPGFPANGCF